MKRVLLWYCKKRFFIPKEGANPLILKVANQKIPILFVKQLETEIRHYVSESSNDWVGLEASLFVDSERRLINARYHTAAHLLGNIVETKYPGLKAVKGHSFPSEAYVEFIGKANVEITEIEKEVRQAIKENLAINVFEILPDEFEQKFYKLPYEVPSHKTFRAMRIGDFSPIPCGGTHVAKTAEIGIFNIAKSKVKGERIVIFYLID